MGKQIILTMFIIVCIAFFNPLSAQASENFSDILAFTDKTANDSEIILFDTITLSDEVSTDSVSIVSDEKNAGAIRNYSVSESGSILVCLERDSTNIYDKNGNFLYAVRYASGYGTCFGLWWNRQPVIFIRGGLCIVVNEEGTDFRMYNYEGNLTALKNKHTYQAYTLNNHSYEAVNHKLEMRGMLGYKLLMTTTSTGDVKVIYCYDRDLLDSCIIFGGIITFLVVCGIGVNKMLREKKHWVT